MSTQEHYQRTALLERNPALLGAVEAIPWGDIGDEPEAKGSDGVVGSTLGHSPNIEADEWPEPAALGGELPPVEAFDPALMPSALRALVEDTAERMQVPLDFPAVVAVLSLAGVVGRRARIQPKAADTSWTVVPNLWGGIIAPPGLMKSPTISAITKPLSRIENESRKEYEAALEIFARDKEEAELKLAVWKEEYKRLTKKGGSAPVRPKDAAIEPKPRRLITQDATFESLHKLMADNPAGMFVICDELTTWLSALEKDGREQERGFYLQAWNGDSPFTADRIGRGSVHVDACCVSMLGGIQPSRLRWYLADALKGGPSNDGLMQRFQLLVYPDITRARKYVDRSPDMAAINKAEAVFRRLAAMDVENAPVFRFTPDAQQLFVNWLVDLESKASDPNTHPALVSHLAKYRSLMPSLALLFELADGGTSTVSLEHAQQAAAWCDYLESHARRVYSMVVSPERQAAADLSHKLAAGWKRTEGMFAVRDVYLNNWSGLGSPEEVRKALPLLEDAGWVRKVAIESGNGRPVERYAINPKLARRAN